MILGNQPTEGFSEIHGIHRNKKCQGEPKADFLAQGRYSAAD
jgi:hypothetical protein